MIELKHQPLFCVCVLSKTSQQDDQKILGGLALGAKMASVSDDVV